MKLDLENISKILFWIAVFILVFMLAWRIVGSSPTLEQLSALFIPVFVYFAIRGDIGTARVKRSINKLGLDMKEQHSEQTQVLKDIRNILKKR